MRPSLLAGLLHHPTEGAGAGAGAPPIVVAIDEPRLRAWAQLAIRRSGRDAVIACDLAGVLEAVAADGAGLLTGAGFAGLSADRLLGFVRGAGSEIPTVIVATESQAALVTRGATFAHVETLIAPDPAADPRRTSWLDRCVAYALGPRLA